MTLIEALRSGKRMRRKSWGVCFWLGKHKSYDYEDIIADDWEVEKDPVTITRIQFDAAWEAAVDTSADGLVTRDELAKELGV